MLVYIYKMKCIGYNVNDIKFMEFDVKMLVVVRYS